MASRAFIDELQKPVCIEHLTIAQAAFSKAIRVKQQSVARLKDSFVNRVIDIFDKTDGYPTLTDELDTAIATQNERMRMPCLYQFQPTRRQIDCPVGKGKILDRKSVV